MIIVKTAIMKQLICETCILPQDKLILLVPASSSLYPDIYKIVNQNISLILSLFLPPYNISKVTVSKSSRKRNEKFWIFQIKHN